MPQRKAVEIAVSRIDAGPNDRKVFDKSGLTELAEAIRAHGLINPISVRASGNRYEIVAGERRYRAVCSLGQKTIAAFVISVSDEEASARMLAENMARSDLNDMEEARAYQSRIERFGWSVEKIAELAGVTMVRVQFRLKLLGLAPELQELIGTRQLTIGYAQIIADGGLDSNRQRIAVDRLRQNGSPTPAWMRREVGELLTQQAQGSLMDLPLLSGEPLSALPVSVEPDPPTPATHKPPRRGRTPESIMRHQAEFWGEAAEQWRDRGKVFKVNECKAAEQALLFALGDG